MATEEHAFQLPGADLPQPDAELRKRREAVVAEHTIAESAWDIDGVLATFPRGGVYRVMAYEESPFIGEEAIKKGYFAELQRAFPHPEHDLFHVHHTPPPSSWRRRCAPSRRPTGAAYPTAARPSRPPSRSSSTSTATS
ncbi:hypothetical protein O1L60_38920 [Streptomyces diastatochromogenes]|nr:hypothetical protein [Streptomyces diastatochromogenes]